ncbi:malonate decarboxylase holo-ACP synthase [Pseudomonas syringae]|uniref:Phosphoribosyl-dephospho-CoA transferase n=1 Tax=Pseudomonas syringae TaxID=317 RepID=A0A085VB28_PSESX|nr:malonate decarboxylase holo-ACP synthase [Pseudomonas syringae]KFE52641.1 phosphoribosyl-dephospho-CoA transferase [Pseudomonas syringae]
MNTDLTVLPHDLLWGMPVSALPADAPGWVIEAVSLEHPVVVRRSLAPRALVAVGIRGPRREQRFAALMPRAAIERCVRPEQLTHFQGQQDWPALQALNDVRPLMDLLGLTWGVSGSAGFELASGVSALHQNSDLDLIVRTPRFVSRDWAAEWVKVLDRAVCRIDVQLQTPFGALALREWAGASRQVLLKSERGAWLVEQPWQLAEACA